METNRKRALVIKDSPLARDPRVLREVSWLKEAGFEVDTLGRGAKPTEVNGTHFAMPRRSVIGRILAYLFLPNRAKYRYLVENCIPEPLRSGVAGGTYTQVVLNEIELLPWFERTRARLVVAGGHAHLDLHEYAPGQRSGVLHRLVFKRWRDYLIKFIPSASIDSRSTVAQSIAQLYADLFGFDVPSLVRNCPPYEDLPVRPVVGDGIRLVHHGVAAPLRSLELLIDAMAEVDDRFTLDFFLVGAPAYLAELEARAQSKNARVTFRDPVAVHDLARTINEFDAEIIFFPPLTENLRLALPNKFFEAVQARLAVVSGQSIEMVNLINVYRNGAIATGWQAADLARAINGLTPEGVTAMKHGSDRAAHDLNAGHERDVLLTQIGVPTPRS